MSTSQFETFWPQFKTLAEDGRFEEIVVAVMALPNQKDQVALLRFTVRGLMFREWKNKNLGPIVQLGGLAIETALKNGDIEEANVICYNMSANLADCWNDGFQRGTEHFQKGLEYANRALEFRKQLQKGPGPFSLAYWARGIHQYCLKDFSAAEESFKESLKASMESAKAENKPTAIQSEAPFSVLIAFGYLAIAQRAQGRKEADETYQNVVSAFEQMKVISEDAKADAELGLNQLRYVSSKIAL